MNGSLGQGPGQLWQFRGLARRFGGTVLVLSLLVSLVVTWVSVHSIESFLVERIERKFPDRLEHARQRLDLWYRQRELDVETFARSGVLLEGLGRSGSAAREEIRRYLAYVLDGSPPYRTLLLLDADGAERLLVGEPVVLAEDLRQRLAAAAEPTVSPPQPGPDGGFQLVSVPVHAGGARTSLHAVLPVSALEAVLRTGEGGRHPEAGEEEQLSLLDARGGPVVGPPAPAELVGRSAAQHGLLVSDGIGGRRVVAAGLPYSRFGWTLAVSEDYDVAFAPVGVAVRRALVFNLIAVLIASAIAYYMGAWRVAPILAVTDAARRLAEGETEVRVPEDGTAAEIRVLARAFNEMASRLAASRSEIESRHQQLEKANQVLEQLSITDGLTKLHNHRHFQDQFGREARRSDRTGSPLVLVLIDIDDFKALNDDLGHAAGDVVLQEAAQVMNEAVRDTDYLARYGGEEFALLAPATDLDGARALAEKIRMGVGEHVFSVSGPEGSVRITVSLGLARYTGDAASTFLAADRALYRAKHSGKDCVVFEDDATT